MRDDVLILIPARGGSKGIPRKNLRPLAGFPLIQWAIEAARQSEIGRVAVSSDDAATLGLAHAFGSVVIQRPTELAEDATPDLPVFLHALHALGGSVLPQILVHLRPTAPFVKPEEIREVVEMLWTRKNLSAVRSVVPAKDHPRKCYIDGPHFGGPTLRPYTERHAANHPRQELERVWKAAGFVDAFRVWCLTSSQQAPDGHVVGPLEAPSDRAIDIDTEEDWRRAEWLAVERGWQPGNIA